MKKHYLLILIMQLSGGFLYSQVTADDAKGSSSILYKSSNIGFDPGAAALSLTFNNYRKLSLIKPTSFIWGLSASANNKDGTAELFNGGKLTAQTKFGGFLGVRINGNVPALELIALRDAVLETTDYGDYKNVITFKAPMLKLVKIDDPTENKIVTDTIKSVFKKAGDMSKIIGLLSPIQSGYEAASKTDMSNALKEVMDSISRRITKAERLQPRYDAANKQFEELNGMVKDYDSTHKSTSWTVFLNGGWNANKFNFYNDTVSSSLPARFDTVKFRGGFIDLGINFDYGARWVFGLSVGYEKFNNLDSFDTKDFSLKTTTTINGQTLTTETKYTGYAGTYIDYGRINVKYDMLYFANLNDDYRLVWDALYIRSMNPINESKIKSTVNLGTSINLYKSAGKVIGGFYVQSTDVFNHMDSKDNFGKRIGFGVVLKYSFSSIANRLGITQ